MRSQHGSTGSKLKWDLNMISDHEAAQSLTSRFPDCVSPKLTSSTVRYSFSVAGHNVDSKNVDSHNVEVIMSKSQNVDNGNGESQNVESVSHTRFRTPGPIGVRNNCHACYQSDVFSLLYLRFNFIA